ncbi:MAG: molybdenum cofactor biosynthesis protein MoaE [Gemmatimonadetes bacterium]|nr:molybdenum cofactor biosynthesis protein MoaE [Gemmatimonadota bacterium]
MRTEFEITEVPLDVARIVGSVADTAAGAIAVFVGTTRKSFEGRVVRHLEYEAYAPLAERTLEEIGTEIALKWPQTIGLAVAHRLGTVDVGEVSVLVAVSAPHRREAFAACEYGIERLKAELPVWKKEVFVDGGAWKENPEWEHERGGEPP